MQQNSLYYFFLVLLCLCLYLPGIVSLPMVDRDSPHFSQATKQMLETDNYLQVKFQQQPRHLKPPGYYWLQALSVKLFSNVKAATNWPYRLPGIIGAILAVLMTFAFTKRYFSKDCALLAAAMLGSCFLLLIETRLTVTDTVLLATMVLMQGGLWQIYVNHKRNKPIKLNSILYFWLGMTVGILIKGITPLVGFLTIITLCIADKDLAWLKKIRFGLGFSLLILLTLAWLIPISMVGKSNFLLDMIKGDVVPKLVGGQQSHGMPPGYFLLIFTLMFWTGSLFVWFGNVWGFRRRKDPIIRFLWAWIVPTWMFFALVPTKLPEYVLPVYPAIAILTSVGLFSRKKFDFKPLTKFLCRLQYVIWVCIGIALITAIIYLPYYLMQTVEITALMVAAVFCLAIIIIFYQVYLQQPIKAAWVGIIASVFIFAPVFGILLPRMQPLWLSKQVNAVVVQDNLPMSSTQPLYSIGYGEPSLVFLLGTQNVHFSQVEDTISQLRQNRGKLILCDERYVENFLHQAKRNNIHVKLIKKIKGFNYSKGEWIQLSLFERIGKK